MKQIIFSIALMLAAGGCNKRYDLDVSENGIFHTHDGKRIGFQPYINQHEVKTKMPKGEYRMRLTAYCGLCNAGFYEEGYYESDNWLANYRSVCLTRFTKP